MLLLQIKSKIESYNISLLVKFLHVIWQFKYYQLQIFENKWRNGSSYFYTKILKSKHMHILHKFCKSFGIYFVERFCEKFKSWKNQLSRWRNHIKYLQITVIISIILHFVIMIKTNVGNKPKSRSTFRIFYQFLYSLLKCTGRSRSKSPLKICSGTVC